MDYNELYNISFNKLILFKLIVIKYSQRRHGSAMVCTAASRLWDQLLSPRHGFLCVEYVYVLTMLSWGFH